MTQARLKYFGWGREGEGLTAEEEAAALDRYRRLFGVDGFDEVAPPVLSAIELRRPRVVPPASLAPCCSSAAYDRVVHTYGKSFRDVVRALRRDFTHPPDVVAFPREEQEDGELGPALTRRCRPARSEDRHDPDHPQAPRRPYYPLCLRQPCRAQRPQAAPLPHQRLGPAGPRPRAHDHASSCSFAANSIPSEF